MTRRPNPEAAAEYAIERAEADRLDRSCEPAHDPRPYLAATSRVPEPREEER